MSKWNYDMTAAPRDGTKIIIAGKFGSVESSRWMKIEGYWLFFAEEKPIAWRHWPKHPHEKGE